MAVGSLLQELTVLSRAWLRERAKIDGGYMGGSLGFLSGQMEGRIHYGMMTPRQGSLPKPSHPLRPWDRRPLSLSLTLYPSISLSHSLPLYLSLYLSLHMWLDRLPR
jgi:hypothetical protein